MKKFLLYNLLFIFSFIPSIHHNPEFEIKHKSGNFVPGVSSNLLEAIQPMTQEKNIGEVYRLIQFYSIPTNAEKKIIKESGIELLSYFPNKAYIAKIGNKVSGSKLNKLNIRSILPIEDNLKLSPQLTTDQLPKWALDGDDIQLMIKYYSKKDESNLVDQIAEKNGKVNGRLSEINVLYVKCAVDKIKELSTNPYIQWIEAVSPPSTPDDTEGKGSTRSNTLNTSYEGGRKYDGSGVVVALSDDGMIGPHIDFTGRVTQHTDISSGNHGDMTSGVFVCAGNLDPTIGGVAPGSDIHIYKQGTTVFLSSYQHIVSGVANLNSLGTVITSTSYSQGQGGIYTSDTEFTDQQINKNQELIHVLSAGNSGTFDHGYGAGAGWANISGGIKAGKNVICAGNVDRNDELFVTSSRGPAADGRIKPDLCAQGEGQRSTDENNTFQVGAGTSASTPAIAGVMAQLYQAYKELNAGVNPESGLVKATLLNTAADLGNPGPDYKYGWGRINGLKAIRVIEENRYIKDNIEQGGNNSHTITVPANVSQLSIMTYWTDVEGNPAAAVALVNDINMQVVKPDNGVLNPWLLDPTPDPVSLNAPATQGIDNLNNAEQVTIYTPEEGDYIINLDGFSIPQGPQEYYVIYDFIYDGVELTYPLGGEGLVPGEIEKVRWDASLSNALFSLEYSTDGGNTYSMIADDLSFSSRSYNWTVPNTISDEVKLRISRGSMNSESHASITIVDAPQNLKIVRVCPDTIELAWDGVDGILSYEVSMLGDKYMDSIGLSANNTFYVVGKNPNEEHWFSVRSRIDGSKGRRAIAIKQSAGTQNCILQNDIELVKLISPVKGVISNCKDLANSSVTVEIFNSGTLAASNIEVSYQLNAGAEVKEIFAGPLMSGESIEYQFSAMVDLSDLGDNNITASVIDPADQNLFNNSVDASFEVIGGSIATLPHEQNFNSFTKCEGNWTTCNLVCNLTEGYVNLENGKWDDIDWRARSGESPSHGFSNTGTAGDYDLNGNGTYLYLESISGCTFKVGSLLSPCIDLSGFPCGSLEFAYLMYGSQMGELHVDVITSDGVYEDIITPVSGDQGDQWILATADLSAFSGEVINIVIRGITGSGSTSVIVIDAISISKEEPIADFNFDISGAGEMVEFSNSSLGGIDNYSWDFGDGNISNEENPTHSYQTIGSFEVTLTISGSCGTATIIKTVMITSTSVFEEQKLEKLVLVYPNPATDFISLQLPLQLTKENVTIELYDVLGNKILKTRTEGQQRVNLKLADFAEGIYFVNVVLDDLRISKKVLVMRN